MSKSLFKGRPCLGFPQFLVMNARVLKKMSIRYHPSDDKPEHTDMLETVLSELHLWPRVSPDVLLELRPVDGIP
uniref:FBD domain-containing protein n=1 Tax=Arundo donax TaxID=35708 RepID=A0A0A9BAD3_ARUDO